MGRWHSVLQWRHARRDTVHPYSHTAILLPCTCRPDQVWDIQPFLTLCSVLLLDPPPQKHLGGVVVDAAPAGPLAHTAESQFG